METLDRITAADLRDARNRKGLADLALSTAKGQLVSAVRSMPFSQLPAPLVDAARKYGRALAVQIAAQDDVARLVQRTARDPEQTADDARVSALVAVFVAGQTLVDIGGDGPHRWRVLRPDGRRVRVPPYTTDRGAMLALVDRLTPAQRRAFVDAFVLALGLGMESDASEAAEAALLVDVKTLAMAALVGVGVDCSAEPPALAE